MISTEEISYNLWEGMKDDKFKLRKALAHICRTFKVIYKNEVNIN